MEESKASPGLRADPRGWIAKQFTRVEDVVYVGLGLLLAGCAVTLLVTGAIDFYSGLVAGTLSGRIIEMLDRILLVLLVVEILYTVQVSFREHTLVPEPFLIIGLIAGTRRILILTAEFPKLLEKGEPALRYGMIELGLLGLLLVALVTSLFLLQKRRTMPEKGAATRT